MTFTTLPQTRDGDGTVSAGTVPRLLSAAACVVLFTITAGFALRRNTERLIEARNMFEHSNEVQADLQNIQLRLDRLDSLGHLYLLNGLWNTLRESQILALTIESGADHVGFLVADNRAQDASVGRLRSCTREITLGFQSLGGGAALPTAALLSCREAVDAMREQERVLLDQREKEAQNSRLSLALAGLSFAAISIAIILVLFGILMRDALIRRRAEERLSDSNRQLAASIEVLEERANELKLVSYARDELQMCLTTGDAYDATVRVVSRLLPASSGSLCIIDNSRQMIEVQAAWGEATGLVEFFTLDACCAMRSGHIRWRSPDSSVVHCSHFGGPPAERYVCIPLVAHGSTLGVLYVECPNAQTMRLVEQRLDHITALLQLASMTIAGVNLRCRLENQSIRDSLTGLFNRHFMEITLEREVRRAARRSSSMAVFMIDADNFKKFNDTFGHGAGDAVLRAIADRFLVSVRGEDIVCRYGGEEFVVILPDITADGAAFRAEQIREAISMLRVADRGQTLDAVTISVGVAIYPQDGATIEELLQASDRSLYVAKNRGRNQVVLAAEAGRTPITARQSAVDLPAKNHAA